MTVSVGGGLQGWFPLTGLPWNLPAVPGICTGPPPTLDGTSSQAHLLVMSLMYIYDDSNFNYYNMCTARSQRQNLFSGFGHEYQ